ncbi:DUF6236 family protein [Kribbella voronezhensis]|nr:DUF6236 family protein [Kribbella voronezhensis]
MDEPGGRAMHEAGLYFPFIHVRDDDWLKLALLYWPRLYRLVPPDYQTSDSRTAREFDAAGLLHTMEPIKDSDANAFFRTLLANVDKLGDYTTARAKAESAGRQLPTSSADGPVEGDLALIHSAKLSTSFVYELRRAGLAELRARLPGGHRWIGVHPTLGAAYMTALANELGSRLRLEPLTDQTDLRIAAPNNGIASALDLLLGRSADHRPDPAAGVDEYVMLALQCVRPKAMGQVSAEQIVDCRENLAAELADFRAFVETQKQELTAITSLPPGQRKLDAFADHVHDTVEAPLQRLERGLQLHKLDTVRTMLVTGTLAAPPLAGMALEQLGAGGTVGMSVGTVAAMGAAWWQVRAARESARAKSPLCYLLDLRDELTPKTIAGRFQRIVKGSY